ncbi:MAG: DUF4390 domain-containing protein [Vicinamibacterales bacterium]
MSPTVQTGRVLRGALLLALLLAGAAPASAQSLRVSPLVRDGRVLVSCTLEHGFDEDVRSIVQSGLRTTFTYTVDLKLKVPMWVDRTIATSLVSTIVEFDNLTRRYTISRTLDGRMLDSRVTEDEAVVQELVTSFDRLALFDTSLLEVNREYYLDVRAVAGPRTRSAIWPWGGAVSGSAKFTFIR